MKNGIYLFLIFILGCGFSPADVEKEADYRTETQYLTEDISTHALDAAAYAEEASRYAGEAAGYAREALESKSAKPHLEKIVKACEEAETFAKEARAAAERAFNSAAEALRNVEQERR